MGERSRVELQTGSWNMRLGQLGAVLLHGHKARDRPPQSHDHDP